MSLNTIFSTLCNHVYIFVYLCVSPGTSCLLFVLSAVLHFGSILVIPAFDHFPIHLWANTLPSHTMLIRYKSLITRYEPPFHHIVNHDPESYIQYRRCLLPFYLRIQLSAERMGDNTNLVSKFFTVLPQTSGTSGQIR